MADHGPLLRPPSLWSYINLGLKMTIGNEMRHPLSEQSGARAPSWAQVTLATTHCGAGCALGDIVSEWLVFAKGLTFAGGEFPTRLTLDLLLGRAFGIVFQYSTIVPTRGLSFGKGLLQAMRADTLAIIAFEIGLFGWMTLAHYLMNQRIASVGRGWLAERENERATKVKSDQQRIHDSLFVDDQLNLWPTAGRRCC
jgi:hypothetical protein